jgi:hypothetical protein
MFVKTIRLWKNFFSKQTAAKTISKEVWLRYFPKHNPDIKWKMSDDKQEITVEVPIQTRGIFVIISRIFRLPPLKRIILDSVGTEVFLKCDGKHSIADILAYLTNTHATPEKEAYASLSSYLCQLLQRNIISLTEKK